MSNIAALTHAHSVVAAKKRAKREQIKEVVFDDDARREFLTGFHKRKLAKAGAARTKAKERQKQERLEARREQRSMLRERALQNAAQVEQAYGAILGDAEDEEEWTGIGNSPQDDQRRNEKYEDEEILATVTVVEDFDPDSIIHGPPKTDLPTVSSLPWSEPKSPHSPPQTKSPQKPTNRKKPRDKKIRYETKDARKRERKKQHARRTEKAELAGGKASRKSTHGGRRKNSSRP